MKSLVQSFLWSVAGVAACLFFFSPRLLIFTEQAPGSYEWTRGLNFLQQISGEAGEKVEPALQHRLLPVVVSELLGLDGMEPFALGWLGVVFLLFITHQLLIRQKLPSELAVCGVFMMASTSGAITSLGWLGIFDCWWIAGLLLLAFSSNVRVLFFVSLLAPWIDERFLIGWPVAFLCRWLVLQANSSKVGQSLVCTAIGVAPYVAWRIYSWIFLPQDSSAEFISSHFLVWLRMVPHGWWMAYRLDWILIFLCFVLPNANRIGPFPLLLVTLCSVAASVITAADITRSAMVVSPLVLTGLVLAYRTKPNETTRLCVWVAAGNFLVPYMHVVYNKTEPVHPLLWEIIRLIKKNIT